MAACRRVGAKQSRQMGFVFFASSLILSTWVFAPHALYYA